MSIELPTNGSYNHTFLCGWNCRPEAVLWTSNKTADQRQVYGQFSVYRAIFSTFFTKLLTMAVIWTLFGVVTNLTCGHVVKTADRGSSMDTFRSSSANCRPKAVLWTLFGPLKSCQQNCWPWQFYGHFSVLQESVHKTADHGSSMDTSILKKCLLKKLLTMAVLWTDFSFRQF